MPGVQGEKSARPQGIQRKDLHCLHSSAALASRRSLPLTHSTTQPQASFSAHLESGDAILVARHLEVHVSQRVLCTMESKGCMHEMKWIIRR